MIFSSALPLVNSSTILSRYLTCLVKVFSISSTLYPQMVPVIKWALGLSLAFEKNSEKLTLSLIS